MKALPGFTLIKHLLKLLPVMSLALICGTAIGQEENNEDIDEFVLDEITVTAQYTETDLQKTPIAISAFTGEKLEVQSITSVEDLGMVIPNANIRQQANDRGPNAQIGLRGVDQNDYMPAFEPGVGVYVDDIYNGTLMGSTLDLLDLERVEVLRGPQGTLFGKNSLGGAIRLISKVPQGDNAGHIEVTAGTYDRLDFNAGYDFSLIPDKLFARISGSSKRIDGYVDRLDYTCQMNANGTPELAGSLPSTMAGNRVSSGDCKIGEKGGSESDAAKIMLRFLPADRLEINVSADYSNTTADSGASTLLRGSDPTYIYNTWVQSNIIDPRWNQNEGDNLSILGNGFVTGDNYTVYESFYDPIEGIIYPEESTDIHKNFSAKVDYDIADNLHLKFIYGYREYEQTFSNVNMTPFSFNGYYVDQEHDQTSYELRINGLSFNERLDWTTGVYYFESNTHMGGFVSSGTFGLYLDSFGLWPTVYDKNDSFTTESKSAFAHAIFAITDKLSVTAGARYTDESKSYKFDNTGLLTIDTPMVYGGSHKDWKLSVDYQFTEDIMGYVMASTGFRSEGANPRPFYPAQLQEISGEEILAYEAGSKADFFGNRLRVNTAVFMNKYDPRLQRVLGAQCTDPTGMDPGEYIMPYGGATCPAGTYAEGTYGAPAFVYLSAPGTSKGMELDISARPINNLSLNASFGYFTYETDVGPDHPGWMSPDYKIQPEYTYNIGAQYRIPFKNGSMLIPRIDMFYQGERSNGGLSTQPIEPYHVVPDYRIYNARLTYMPSDTRWSVSLEVKNLFDTFYWVDLDADLADNGVDLVYDREGIPGPPRMMAVTFKWNFF